MNPDLEKLQPYPFEKLNALKAGTTPPDKPHIALSIGEPKHATPGLIAAALQQHLESGLATYPLTKGMPALREAICEWLTRRFALPPDSLDPERHALPVNGTREALFAFAQAVVDRTRPALVLSPNPFYQIYEGAALLAGATPHFIPCTAETGYLPAFDDVDDATWDQCQLLFLCSPGNPTGAVIPQATLQALIERAERHDFVIASDECYSEIYFDEDKPPVGLLQAAAAMGNNDYRRCVVFHSLSKRSNAPGLRSGFVAGDADLLTGFLRYRTYHGCALPVQHQHASIAAWRDEEHVKQNRAMYRAKFDAVLEILDGCLDVQRPDAGFYLWPRTPGSDETFARDLFDRQHVTVLPGRYLSREVDGISPGAGHVRMALVATLDECVDAAHRIKDLVSAY
ncbi:succinyldiaminopimelate transaminase [Thiosocius teredinicola]|uniref:succinyldiaminopimelate transaminase n=1 Tax=Thiosocius teredinicola TaxID=1973002 RepID=UPI000990FA7B